MAFLAKGTKEDIKRLVIELGGSPSPEIKVVDLKNLITKNTSYEEEFFKGILEPIISSGVEEESPYKTKLELEAQRNQMEFELKKLEIESVSCSSEGQG